MHSRDNIIKSPQSSSDLGSPQTIWGDDEGGVPYSGKPSGGNRNHGPMTLKRHKEEVQTQDKVLI